ncbi:hypothetical protein BKA67DRAFT_655185 [Truncatella angustata]|uniref:Secreted protein n=1 Tax=Truncatella angustata TaxID=152316 RepID=A0A9P8URU4_9PEZI|nr:uncharacterized protein BKA67DRAFT_655185 [Truncatella angustata]KAH6656880.1 hypothetical protein BKA67DRAFT_655185 [Truncatella angustata]
MQAKFLLLPLHTLAGIAAVLPVFNKTNTENIGDNQTDVDVQPAPSFRRADVIADEMRDGTGDGRPGKVPYRKLPPCYVKCFDSEGQKTWPAIGDVRDLTADEFCHSQWTWSGNWIKEHLQFCVAGECDSCPRHCYDPAKKWFDDVCGRPGL